MIETIDIDTLDTDTINVTSTHIDWRQAMGENCEGWRVISPGDFVCDNGSCEKVMSNGDDCICEDGGVLDEQDDWMQCAFCLGSQQFEDLADGSPCPQCGEGTLHDYDWIEAGDEPMMSYFYAVPDMDERHGGGLQQLARNLNEARVALVLIEFGEDSGLDGYALALSGGGMDLRWDICAAFMAIGCSPPVEFTRLPQFAGHDYTSERNKKIVAACIRSNTIARDRATHEIEQLEALGKETK